MCDWITTNVHRQKVFAYIAHSSLKLRVHSYVYMIYAYDIRWVVRECVCVCSCEINHSMSRSEQSHHRAAIATASG